MDNEQAFSTDTFLIIKLFYFRIQSILFLCLFS